MTESEAISLVTAKRKALRIGPSLEPSSAEKAIVEYSADRTKPGPVENRIAWVVTLVGATGFVIVHVDDRSREVLEVIRSA